MATSEFKNHQKLIILPDYIPFLGNYNSVFVKSCKSFCCQHEKVSCFLAFRFVNDVIAYLCSSFVGQ